MLDAKIREISFNSFKNFSTSSNGALFESRNIQSHNLLSFADFKELLK